MTEQEQIRQYEDENYQQASGLLGDSMGLPEDLVDVYRLLVDTAAKSPRVVQDDVFAAVTFANACRYHMQTAILAALRGHITDSSRSLRMAIETAAFAARIKQDPQAAAAWLKAGDDEASYKAYRKMFGKLFAGAHPILTELGKRYDTCSKQSHPSALQFAQHNSVTRTSTHTIFGFEYFQLKSDGSEPVRTFLWILNTHVLIVKLMRELLTDAIADDAVRIDLTVNGVEAKLAVHTQRWVRLIPSMV